MSVSRRVRGRVLIAAILTAVLTAGGMQAASASTDTPDPSAPDSVSVPSRSQGGNLFGDLPAAGLSPQDRAQTPAQDLPAETGSVTGRVYNVSWQGLGDVEVGAFRATGDPADPVTFVESVVSDQNGYYTFDALPIGDYDLWFFPTGNVAASWLNGGPSPSLDAPLHVTEGATVSADISLQNPFPVGGSVTGGVHGKLLEGVTARLWASTGEASGWWFYAVDEVESAADGTYAFAQVPPGYYTIEFLSPTNTYKGEWWNNKASFETSNVFFTEGRAYYAAAVNLQQRVTLGTVGVSGASATGAKLTATYPALAGVTYKYSWYADGAAIAGATGKTFVPTPAQQDTVVTVKVKASKPGLISTTKSSGPRAKVLLTAIPSISGTAAVGSTLKGWSNRWTTGATLRYQWYANGTAISGATGKSYVVKTSDRGKQITLKVSGSKEGYGSYARTSPATPRVP